MKTAGEGLALALQQDIMVGVIRYYVTKGVVEMFIIG
jgi:hypothetical protein